MNNKILYIGVDNGVSGSIGIIKADGSDYWMVKMPTFSEQDYVKKKANVTRISVLILRSMIKDLIAVDSARQIKFFLERPMVNPKKRFKATASALRAWEAVLIAIGTKHSRYYIDSREWQKVMLPHGVHGDELKRASVDVGCRLFPACAEQIRKHKDADGLLIAEYARRKQL